MTIDDIDQQIAALTERLHGDTRATRNEEDGTEIGLAFEIRAERSAVKAERSRLRKLRAALLLAEEAKVAPRARETILAELAELRAQKLAIVERSKIVARELARGETADELAAMPPAKRAALAQMLEVERIASTAKVHAPGKTE